MIKGFLVSPGYIPAIKHGSSCTRKSSYLAVIFVMLYSKPGVIQNKMTTWENCHRGNKASTVLLASLFLDFISEKGCFWSLFFLSCLSLKEHSELMEGSWKIGLKSMFLSPSRVTIRKYIHDVKKVHETQPANGGVILLSILGCKLQEGERILLSPKGDCRFTDNQKIDGWCFYSFHWPSVNSSDCSSPKQKWTCVWFSLSGSCHRRPDVSRHNKTLSLFIPVTSHHGERKDTWRASEEEMACSPWGKDRLILCPGLPSCREPWDTQADQGLLGQW